MLEVVSVPKEVHEAFTRLKRNWSSYLSKEEMNFMFLVLVGTYAVGDALTLKKFAANNPTTYLKALANGYTVRFSDGVKHADDTENEVASVIKRWLNTPYEHEDINQDILKFAKELTTYFQQ